MSTHLVPHAAVRPDKAAAQDLAQTRYNSKACTRVTKLDTQQSQLSLHTAEQKTLQLSWMM